MVVAVAAVVVIANMAMGNGEGKVARGLNSIIAVVVLLPGATDGGDSRRCSGGSGGSDDGGMSHLRR